VDLIPAWFFARKSQKIHSLTISSARSNIHVAMFFLQQGLLPPWLTNARRNIHVAVFFQQLGLLSPWHTNSPSNIRVAHLLPTTENTSALRLTYSRSNICKAGLLFMPSCLVARTHNLLMMRVSRPVRDGRAGC